MHSPTMRYQVAFVSTVLVWQCASSPAGLHPAAIGEGVNFNGVIAQRAVLPAWPNTASWTIVHAKKKHSLLTTARKSLLSFDGEEHANDDPTLEEQIAEMGKDLCKSRPDDPKCKQFQKKEKEEEEEQEEEEKKKEEVATEAATTAAPVKVEEATEAPTQEPVKKEPKSQAKEESGKKPPKLPSQGLKGKKVRHEDGETMTRDWGDEYEHSSTGKPEPEAAPSKSAAPIVSVSSTLLGLCLLKLSF